ncbi:hypothetical protein ACROYT_G042110, partial [Oculina patagonica]
RRVIYLSSGTCKEYEFSCGNGNCIKEWNRCWDGDQCGDNSDEQNCCKSSKCFISSVSFACTHALTLNAVHWLTFFISHIVSHDLETTPLSDNQCPLRASVTLLFSLENITQIRTKNQNILNETNFKFKSFWALETRRYNLIRKFSWLPVAL